MPIFKAVSMIVTDWEYSIYFCPYEIMLKAGDEISIKG
jgi:hypothetical protein